MINTKSKDLILSALVEIVDILYVPGSLLRFAHKKRMEGVFNIPDDQESAFQRGLAKTYPYLQATCLEGLRLYTYYYIGEKLFS